MCFRQFPFMLICQRTLSSHFLTTQDYVICVSPVNPSLIHEDSFHIVQFFFVLAEHQPFLAEVSLAIFFDCSFQVKTRTHITIVQVRGHMLPDIHLTIQKIGYFVYSVVCYLLVVHFLSLLDYWLLFSNAAMRASRAEICLSTYTLQTSWSDISIVNVPSIPI